MNHATPAHLLRIAPLLLNAIWLANPTSAHGQATKSTSFDEDPKWEALNNHITPARIPTITQDFGYSPTTHFAGKDPGEIGGRVTRAATPAYYGDPTVARTLNDPLSATGTFAITRTSAGGGLFFGWFNSKQPGGAGRPMNSLGLHLDSEHGGGRLAVRLITGSNKSTGTFITPFERGNRPTPIKNDGTRYTFHLTYDPAANNGDGQFQFTITSNCDKPDAWEGKPFTVNLPPGYKADGATFDRFGLMNMMKPGGTVTIHFDDLLYDGKLVDFSKDPNWAGSNNHAQYQDATQVGAHDFGYSPKTNFAGGAAPGEIGGIFWRTEKNFGHYADTVGPLSLDDRLEASGKVILAAAGPDSDMCLGWFASSDKDVTPTHAGNFLGVHVGGPTRVGHYFQPAFTAAGGTRPYMQAGPVLTPGKAYDWTLSYDPAASGGNGAIHLTLGTDSVSLPLKPDHRKAGAHFDRFGLLSVSPGGQMVKIYLDDLKYSAAAAPR